jgi:hypothetical protein
MKGTANPLLPVALAMGTIKRSDDGGGGQLRSHNLSEPHISSPSVFDAFGVKATSPRKRREEK